MTRILAFLLLACDVEFHAPDITDPTCARMAIAVYTAPAGKCVRLSDQNGLTLFRLAESDSCGGPSCIVLQPGQTALALRKVAPGPDPHWHIETDECDAFTTCE